MPPTVPLSVFEASGPVPAGEQAYLDWQPQLQSRRDSGCEHLYWLSPYWVCVAGEGLLSKGMEMQDLEDRFAKAIEWKCLGMEEGEILGCCDHQFPMP